MSRWTGRDRRGQTLVEFALILLPFLMIIIGLFDVGRAIYGYNTVANAARTAARVAIVDQDLLLVERAAVDEAVGLGLQWTPGVGSTDVVFTTCATQYCPITVTVNWDYTPITPLIGEIFNPTISSTATMPIEVVNP
jgi:Flp pilus assembly protein TadG